VTPSRPARRRADAIFGWGQDAGVQNGPVGIPAGDRSTPHRRSAWSSREKSGRVISSGQENQPLLAASPWHRYVAADEERCGRRSGASGRPDASNHGVDERALLWSRGAGQESSLGRQRVEGTKESEALDEFTYQRIPRDHAFGFTLAEGQMNRPLLGSNGARRRRLFSRSSAPQSAAATHDSAPASGNACNGKKAAGGK